MAEVKKYGADGKEAGKAELPDAVFAARVRERTVQQSLLRQLGNKRKANPRTLTKGDVAGGGKKPWRQKGTGRARHGSTRNPQWRGGGVAHGPDGRKYATAMNKKERRAAMASLLTDKVRKEEVFVMAPPAFDAPKTKKVVELLQALGVEGNRVLFVTQESDGAFQRSVRNLPRVKALSYRNLNPHDLMRFDRVFLTEDVVQPIVDQLTAARKPAKGEEAEA